MKVYLPLVIAFVVGMVVPPRMVSQVPSPQPPNPPFEINTALMEATFKLEGRDENNQPLFGTGFLMGRPLEKETTRARYVLITAAHVLNEMKGDVIKAHSRRKADGDKWVRVPFTVAIRSNGRPLFAALPDADVAVMYLPLPEGVTLPLLSTEMLADDNALRKYEIHPGDEVRCLGYPLSLEANDAGFPILRSGKIASYPLLPTDVTKTFLLDFKVFKGNSGGPVYFADSGRTYGNTVHMGENVLFIIGLVSGEGLVEQKISGPYTDEIRRLQLDLGIVVHASQIKKAINLLPAPDTLPN